MTAVNLLAFLFLLFLLWLVWAVFEDAHDRRSNVDHDRRAGCSRGPTLARPGSLSSLSEPGLASKLPSVGVAFPPSDASDGRTVVRLTGLRQSLK